MTSRLVTSAGQKRNVELTHESRQNTSLLPHPKTGWAIYPLSNGETSEEQEYIVDSYLTCVLQTARINNGRERAVWY